MTWFLLHAVKYKINEEIYLFFFFKENLVENVSQEIENFKA